MDRPLGLRGQTYEFEISVDTGDGLEHTGKRIRARYHLLTQTIHSICPAVYLGTKPTTRCHLV